MAFRLVIAEKPSMAQTIAAALGIKGKQDGYIEGGGYLISWCVGHLVQLAEAAAYGEQYKKWSFDTGSNIKNGVLTAYPFCRRNGSTPLTRTRGSNSKPLKSLCTAPTFPKW